MSDVLGLLGLPADAEAVYEYLLDGGATTAADLATATGLTGQRVRALMRQMEARGLVHRVGSSTGSPPRYAASTTSSASSKPATRRSHWTRSCCGRRRRSPAPGFGRRSCPNASTGPQPGRIWAR